MNTRDHVCDYIGGWLDKNKVTNKSLAQALGVSDVSVKRWRDHDCAPDINLFPKLCEFMGITVNELLGMDNSELATDELTLINEYRSDPKLKDLIETYLSDNKYKTAFDYLIDIILKR